MKPIKAYAGSESALRVVLGVLEAVQSLYLRRA
jgi:hypothetical protein